MSDSDESGVTYTEVSSPFEGLSDIGSPRADDHEYLELPGMPEDPYATPSPDYVPGPEHTDDEIVAEDQPDAKDASPTAQSPDYVPESDSKADPVEDDDEDPEEDPVDYSVYGGDDGDDEDEPSEEDKDDDVDIEADRDEEEEEEHPAPADSVVVALPAADQAPSAEETESSSLPMPVWSDAEVARLLAISTPPSSPLSPWSSPLPQIPSPSLPLSPPSPLSPASTSHSLPLPPPFILSPTRPDAPSLGIPPPLPISVPTSSPPLLLPSASRREDRPEVTLPPRKRLGIAPGPGYEVEESSSAAAARRLEVLGQTTTLLPLWIGRSGVIQREMLDMGSPTRGIRELRPFRWRQAVTLEMLKAYHRRSAKMRELRIADHTQQQQLIQTLTVMQSLQGQVTILQGQVTALQGQQGPAGGPTQPELPEEAGSSS
ncbi:hypothetical protein Tco_0045881 [Tanacetum coccineum]